MTILLSSISSTHNPCKDFSIFKLLYAFCFKLLLVALLAGKQTFGLFPQKLKIQMLAGSF
jgi:hypothetical protein